MSNIIHLDAEIDFDAIKETIEGALKLEDNQDVFYALIDVARVKEQVKILLEKVETVERDAKGLVNSKAKALYGDDWQTIVGKGYKINRSPTGSIYIANPDIPVSKKFLIIKESVNAKAVDEYVIAKEKLPKGIEINPSRGYSITIKVKDEDS